VGFRSATLIYLLGGGSTTSTSESLASDSASDADRLRSASGSYGGEFGCSPVGLYGGEGRASKKGDDGSSRSSPDDCSTCVSKSEGKLVYVGTCWD